MACGEGRPWVCEHRRPEIAAMISFRQAVADALVQGWQSFDDGSVIAFSRGQVGFLAINRGDGSFWGKVATSLPSGVYVDLIGNTTVHVEVDGQAQVEIGALSALALLRPGLAND